VTACEKLRVSVPRAVPRPLVAANGAARATLAVFNLRIGTDLALAPRYRFLCWYNLHMETTSLVAAIALTPYEDRETATSVRAPTELLQTEMVAE
jgi:hypothetical protein